MSSRASIPLPVRWIFAAVAAWLVGFEIAAALPSHPGSDGSFGDWGSAAVQTIAALLCAERARRMAGSERLAWALIAGGIFAWTFGDVYWIVVLNAANAPPIPSPADVGYLTFTGLAFAGMVILVHARAKHVARTLAVDGVIAALAVAAVSAAVVLGPVGNTAEGGIWAVATNLAYPITDLVFLGVAVGAIAMRGWRLERTWVLLALGTIAFWIADSLYLVQSAHGTYTEPNLYGVGWPASTVLFAFAAWQPVPELRAGQRRSGMREILLPMLFALVALGVLVGSDRQGLDIVAIVLAAASIVAVMARLVMTHRQNMEMLGVSRVEALTDTLTGLGNRRALMLELEHSLPAASDAVTLVLVMFDLDGFKHYNDTFGHPAGDDLLARMGGHLARSLEGRGMAFRMGGDEFCALITPGPEVAMPIVEAAAAALSEHGKGFSIGCSHGAVWLPREAEVAAEALRIADQRMYAAKNSSRVSAGRQSKDVLLRALTERDPYLGEHTADVASLAEAVAERLGLSGEDVEQISHAAELHDIGKVAIPDAILHKPGPLDDLEWAFIRRHTLIGERIINGAPALERVAALVRSSHERYDGAGYPDGLAGSEIPLGSRIVAICDAFDAMTTDRAYRTAVPAEAAVAELHRCGGTQFDPVVVQAFAAAWAARGQPAPSLRA